MIRLPDVSSVPISEIRGSLLVAAAGRAVEPTIRRCLPSAPCRRILSPVVIRSFARKRLFQEPLGQFPVAFPCATWPAWPSFSVGRFLRKSASCRPPSPRSATNIGWPTWPTSLQAAQSDARQSVAARTPASGETWTILVGQLGQLQCRPISPQIGVLPPPPRSATNKGWPPWPTSPAGGAKRCKTKCCRKDSGFGETRTTLCWPTWPTSM
jgi:hypothetical protein